MKMEKIINYKYLSIFIKGLSLGLLLQLAIGPVCLFVFKNSVDKGFLYSELIVIGVFIIDAFYIFWAIFGVSTFIKSNNAKIISKIIGFIILLIFGINIIVSEFVKINLIPKLAYLNNLQINNPIILGLLLTLSNPLTVIFWIGIFSSKIGENNFTRKELILYGIGALIPTIIFLTIIALLGIILKMFLSSFIISFLNIVIGVLILYFAVKILLKKKQTVI